MGLASFHDTAGRARAQPSLRALRTHSIAGFDHLFSYFSHYCSLFLFPVIVIVGPSPVFRPAREFKVPNLPLVEFCTLPAPL